MSMYERKKLTRWQKLANKYLTEPMTALELSLTLADAGLFYNDNNVRSNLITLVRQNHVKRISGNGTPPNPYYYELSSPAD